MGNTGGPVLPQTTDETVSVSGGPVADDGTAGTITLTLTGFGSGTEPSWTQATFSLSINTTTKRITPSSPQFTYNGGSPVSGSLIVGGDNIVGTSIVYTSKDDNNYVIIYYVDSTDGYCFNVHMYYMIPAQSTNEILSNVVCVYRNDNSGVTNPFEYYGATFYTACSTN